MAWALNADRPIYAQLVDRIQLQIVAGQLNPGEKILSVRELAAEAAVNPNTMQKALAELERKGLLYSQRTSGRFVTEDRELIGNVKEEMAAEQISAFLENMKQLGFNKKETIRIIEKLEEEREGTI